ncbi:MAG: MgtC/SapB family protein [Planctomycetaceae bacterium]|nr:MgtC/SapB family protein [Planctomycetaceae bacterium]
MEPLFQQLGIALLLGLLVGLQREHAESGMAGMRTFPLITVLGSLSAVLAGHFQDSWILAAGLLAIAAMIVVGHAFRSQRPDAHPGMTTDAALLLMYVVGAMVVIGPLPVAIAVGGGAAVLLQFKPELHGIARKLGDEDLRAIMQFVLITCIILPVLPNRTYGPYHVLNPFETWLMVVLIVGLSLGGYIAYKFFGRDAGIFLGGVLGGAISSTATTVSYARGARNDPAAQRAAAVVILIASTVMYLRVLLSVGVVSLDFLAAVWPFIAALMLLTSLPALALWFRVRQQPSTMPEPTNPTQLTSALVFGMLYAAVLLALAIAKNAWHGEGLFAVAFLSGLTEMDAITLSTARMSIGDPQVAVDGWRLLVVAAMANMVSKSALAGILGGWQLLVRVVLLFVLPTLGGVALLALV